MTPFDIALLVVTALTAGGAVIWACRELGGALEWFAADGSDDMQMQLQDADVIAGREELLSR